jgi:hypothetical protein
MKIEPMPEGTGALIARMAADDRKAASELATPVTAGPVPVVAAVATGSNPASVGVLDMLEWKWRSIAAQHRKSAEQTQSSHESTRFKSAAEALEACALELRLLTGATTERQPESNSHGQPRREDKA